MKFIEQEKAPSGKKRLLFAVGYEEIELLFDLVKRYSEILPRTSSHKPEIQVLHTMVRGFTSFFNTHEKLSKKPHKNKDHQCKYCKRMCRGEEALKKHHIDVHSRDKSILESEE